MSYQASAMLFYGVTLSRDEVIECLKYYHRNDTEVLDILNSGDCEAYLEDFEMLCADLVIGPENGVSYALQVWATTCYADDLGWPGFKLPDKEEVEQKWCRVVDEYHMMREPSWHLHAYYG